MTIYRAAQKLEETQIKCNVSRPRSFLAINGASGTTDDEFLEVHLIIKGKPFDQCKRLSENQQTVEHS